jgi:hypothetical protein
MSASGECWPCNPIGSIGAWWPASASAIAPGAVLSGGSVDVTAGADVEVGAGVDGAVAVTADVCGAATISS